MNQGMSAVARWREREAEVLASAPQRAAAHAESIRDAASRLSVALVEHPGTGSLGWYASIGSRPVMMTPAWHRTARDRDRSVATALQALDGAKILAAAQHGHRHLSETVPADVLTGHLL